MEKPHPQVVTKNNIPKSPYTMDGIPCNVSVVSLMTSTNLFPLFAYSTRKIAAKIPTGVIAAVIVLRKNATVKVLDLLVPVMAVLYFVITLFIIFTNLGSMPGVFKRIFEEAFGFRQAVAGGFGVVLMKFSEATLGFIKKAHLKRICFHGRLLCSRGKHC